MHEYYRIKKGNALYSCKSPDLNRKQLYRCDRMPPTKQIELSDEQIRILWARREQCQDDEAIAEIDELIYHEMTTTNPVRAAQVLRATLACQVRFLLHAMHEFTKIPITELNRESRKIAEEDIQDPETFLQFCGEILKPDYFDPEPLDKTA